jgi:hypothetical protein
VSTTQFIASVPVEGRHVPIKTLAGVKVPAATQAHVRAHVPATVISARMLQATELLRLWTPKLELAVLALASAVDVKPEARHARAMKTVVRDLQQAVDSSLGLSSPTDPRAWSS